MIFSLSGCETTEAAEKCADEFFNHIISSNYEKAATLVAVTPFDGYSKAEALEKMLDKSDYGALLKAEKSFGFNTQINNGISTVQLPYELTYENGSYTFNLVIVDRGNGFKIEGMQ